MKIFLYIILFSLTVLFSGCIGYEEIRVVKIKDVSYREFRNNTLKLAIVVTVDNPNYFKVKITGADMKLRFQESVVGNITQIENIEIDRRTKKDYTIQVAIEMKDLMSNVLNISRMFMNDSKHLNLSGTVHVKSFLYSNTFHIENMSFQ